MIFVNNIDVFLLYEKNDGKQVYITAEILNKELKSLIKNDEINNNNILYLNDILNKLNEKLPKETLDNYMDYYFQKNEIESSNEYKKLFLDFGKIKKWEV